MHNNKINNYTEVDKSFKDMSIRVNNFNKM